MKIKFKKLIIVTLTLIMFIPQTVNAGWGNNNGNDKTGKTIPYGQLKKIERYQEMDSNRIRVGNKHINFEVPPVLKDNRTLIPVRAVTEALGCDVKWVEPKAFIISPAKDKIIVFDLESSKVFVAEGWTYEELLALDNQATWDSLEVTIDAPPGLINNRTFVPLRFIAEELGLKVGYNSDTGMIDIDKEPVISPQTLVVEELSLLPTTYKIDVELNGFELKGIEDLTIVDDYTINEDNDIILTESYLKDIKTVTSELVIMFEKDTVKVNASFIIKLNYLADKPVLTPDTLTFTEGETDGLSYDIAMDLYGFSLIQVSSSSVILTADTHYSVAGEKVTIKEAFLKDLSVGKTEMSFLFTRNSETKTVILTINVLEAPAVVPVITTTPMYLVSTEDLPTTKDIVITLNDYTLKEVKDLVKDVDYTVANTIDGDLTLTLLSTYLTSIDEAKTDISLVFENENEVDLTLNYIIELEFLYLKPVLSPLNFAFKKSETDNLQLVIQMELYSFELQEAIENSISLALDTDYSINTNNELVINESYIKTLDVGPYVINLTFKRGNETVYINCNILVTE